MIPWSAEEPALYRLIVTLRDEEGIKDTVSLDLGFRSIEATSQGVTLGGKALILRGRHPQRVRRAHGLGGQLAGDARRHRVV